MGNQTAPLAAPAAPAVPPPTPPPPPAPPPPHGFAASPDLCARAVAVRRRYQLAGRWCGGVVPYGYRATDAASGLVVHAEEAGVVRWIFARILWHSSNHVAHMLNARDIRSPRGRLGGWSHAGVAWIVRNRVYLGGAGSHEGVVSPAEFAAAGAALASRVRRRSADRPA